MKSTDVKAVVQQQEIIEPVVVSCIFFCEVPLRLEMQCSIRLVFFI